MVEAQPDGVLRVNNASAIVSTAPTPPSSAMPAPAKHRQPQRRRARSWSPG